MDGGFTGPRANGSCDEVGLFGLRETWNFDQCPGMCSSYTCSAPVQTTVCMSVGNCLELIRFVDVYRIRVIFVWWKCSCIVENCEIILANRFYVTILSCTWVVVRTFAPTKITCYVLL